MHSFDPLGADRPRVRSVLTCGMLITVSFWASAAVCMGQLPEFKGFGAKRPGGFGLDSEIVSVSAEFARATAERPAILFVTAQIAPGFHLYAIDQGALPDGGGPMPTTVKIADTAGVKLLGGFRPLVAPETHIDKLAWVGLELREHERRVTWAAPVEIAAETDLERLAISGVVDGLACKDNCVPVNAKFSARVGDGYPLPEGFELDRSLGAAPAPDDTAGETTQRLVDNAGSSTAGGALKLSHSPTNDSSTLQGNWASRDGASRGADANPPAQTLDSGPAYDIGRIELEAARGSLAYYLATAFLGGIILNVMPCVLPVIGLKIMSFVQQAGESRARAWMLNMWYSAGIVAVFLVLAAMAVLFKQGWGDQFASAKFNVSLLAVVFAMALSLLGVWEIPIPGFVGSGAALEMAEREGPAAAFFKGILTTLLATPCTGPFMAAALTWAVRQPAWTAFMVFGMLGIGMATPYLVIGAFPSLIRVLPRPGMWMETFKKAMGLVLLATVVWMLSFFDPPLVVPSVALMAAITGICGWMARTPGTAPLEARLYSWAIAGMALLVASLACFGYLYQKVMLPRSDAAIAARAMELVESERQAVVQALEKIDGPEQLAEYRRQLAASQSSMRKGAWQPFSLDNLGQLTLQEKRTVLVDFTAEWCLQCQALEFAVLKSEEVSAALAAAEVVTMIADYTRQPEWMKETLNALDSIGVPVIAIFPADRPYQPIVFRGAYSKDELLLAIQRATGAAPRIASSSP